MTWYVEDFFFSSRRRHTRSKRDWSSDVCSSDLDWQGPVGRHAAHRAAGHRAERVTDEEEHRREQADGAGERDDAERRPAGCAAELDERSEERRVGKERRGGGSPGQSKESFADSQ